MSATTQRRIKGASRGSSEFRIGFLVHDVSRLRQAVFDQAMKPHGVTHAQWWALAQLTRHDPAGGMTQVELARLLGLGKAATGAMIVRLAAAGLVSRRADASDRRLNRVYVTARGQRVLERMNAQRDFAQGPGARRAGGRRPRPHHAQEPPRGDTARGHRVVPTA